MRCLLLLLVSLGSAVTLAAKEVPVDPVTGMKMAEHWELVRNHCVICHSPKTFLQQRGTKSTWTAVLEWMQTSGRLWKLQPEVEETIIAYLTENYGPEGSFRRAPIPPTLMPTNPYATPAKLEAEAKKKEGLIPPAPPVSK